MIIFEMRIVWQILLALLHGILWIIQLAYYISQYDWRWLFSLFTNIHDTKNHKSCFEDYWNISFFEETIWSTF